MREFIVKPIIKFGECSLEFIKDLGKKRAFIVTDKTIVQLGVTNKITEVFDEIHGEYMIFDEVEPNPSITTVEKGLKQMVKFTPDIVIALGGGSPIDACKAILCFYTKVKEKLEHMEMYSTTKKPIFLAIPTTSGTGSEVTSYSIITEGHRKVALLDPQMLPDMAVLNPDFTKTLPKNVIANTGMDVLAHSTEAFVSKNKTSFSDPMALGAIELIYRYLYRHYMDVSELEPREKVQQASCIAGIAFNNSSLGINHSIAHALGGKFKMAHGRAIAIVMPYVIEENMTVVSELYAEIARKIGLPAQNTDEGAMAFLIFVKEMRKLLQIPNTLQEAGIIEEEFIAAIPELLTDIRLDVCTEFTPKSLTDKEYEALLLKIYYGSK